MFEPCCWSVGTACFTTHENKPCNLICCKTGSNVGGRTRNIAIQLVLQWHAVKTSCTFLLPVSLVCMYCPALTRIKLKTVCLHPHYLCRYFFGRPNVENKLSEIHFSVITCHRMFDTWFRSRFEFISGLKKKRLISRSRMRLSDFAEGK